MSTPPADARTSRTARIQIPLLSAFAAAVALRVWYAASLPMIARDGALYVEYAKRLGSLGPAALRQPDFDQHPLFPLLLLGAHRALAAIGLPDSPLLWQRAGQMLSLLAGGVVLLLVAAIARRWVESISGDPTEIQNPKSGIHDPGWLAVALAGALPLNVWLSADVMTEQVFLAFELTACLALIGGWRVSKALIAGTFAGLAFLTRPEAIVLVPGIIATGIVSMRAVGARRSFMATALAIAAFAGVVSPYWLTIGRFSAKSDKATTQTMKQAAVERGAAKLIANSVGHCGLPLPGSPIGVGSHGLVRESINTRSKIQNPKSPHATARLVVEDAAWYAAPLIAAYETSRAGRIVIPLLAIPVLIAVRRKLLAPQTVGVVVAFLGHFALMAWLRYRHGYLDPRHALLLVELLIAPAAIGLANAIDWLQSRRVAGAPTVLVLLCIAPLLAYAIRLPDAKSGHLLAAADWLRSHVDAADSPRVIGPSSHRRIAFYADLPFVRWPDDSPSIDRRTALLIDTIGPADAIVTLETGPGFEREGSDEVLRRLQSPNGLGDRVESIDRLPGESGITLCILRVVRPAPL